MPSGDDLKFHFSRLTDDELGIQLVEERLTEEANQVAREELASRGVAVEEAISNARSVREQAMSRVRVQQQERSASLRCVLRFPIRAILGVESPWLVLVVGLVLAYPLYRFTVSAIGALVLQRPLPSYALPLSYAVLAIFELASLWFAVAL
ncbi:hypothetical protein [Piscinibacter defluvii]|uniref:hypothetical protein n=1 Tax=Piscinibacter defluvii TaxID=1796922 RepID=UPI000FDD64F0|nr:hypothetical protein [Piscinibacter defluvii]